MLRMIQMVAGMAMLSLAMGCGSSSPIPGVPLPSLVNGSFETGDFTGWVTQDLTDPLAPLAVGPSGATDGVSGVQTGFDGNGGPGNDSIFVAQDVDLTGIASAAVRFDWAVGDREKKPPFRHHR